MSEHVPDARQVEGPDDEATALDVAAVRAVRDGRRDAYAHLVKTYQRRIFGLILMMLRNEAGAADVTQDAFVRAFTYLGQYDERRPFYPWIATIAIRLAQNWIRANVPPRPIGVTALGEADEPTADAGQVDAMVNDERDRQLWANVAHLPPGERAAVVLHYREDLKVRDVARVLGVTTGTVKTLLFRARRRLRQRLTHAGPLGQDGTS